MILRFPHKICMICTESNSYSDVQFYDESNHNTSLFNESDKKSCSVTLFLKRCNFIKKIVEKCFKYGFV